MKYNSHIERLYANVGLRKVYQKRDMETIERLHAMHAIGFIQGMLRLHIKGQCGGYTQSTRWRLCINIATWLYIEDVIKHMLMPCRKSTRFYYKFVTTSYMLQKN